MSHLLHSYIALLPSSSGSDVTTVLACIRDASPATIDSPTRVKLIEALLADLETCSKSKGECRLKLDDAFRALSALKTLGKHPSGSELLALPANLSLLLSLSTLIREREASSEALRCVANALLIVEKARSTWVSEEVNGGTACITLLETSTSLDQIFLASRILFFCTASESLSGQFICSVVEGQHNGRTIVEIIEEKLDALTTHVLARTEMSSEAMTDLLKFTFNLLLHYPKLVSLETHSLQGDAPPNSDQRKVMGDFWNPALDGFLPSLLRAFSRLPLTSPAPLAPPLTHVIHSLITIPVSPRFRSSWESSGFPSQPTSSPSSDLDVLARAFNVLDASSSYHLPGSVDPDDPLVIELCKKAGDTTLDNTLVPLTLLITRLCLADDTSRGRLKDWLLPSNLDRTSSLESRPNLLGRCLRLLASVYHVKLKDAMGEMLFAICNSDAAMLSSQVGYGNVAGFLFHKGIMNSPISSSASLTTPSGAPINPITGTIDGGVAIPQMTDEEKESEAEKLFVLFDRLEKSGAISPGQNLMRKALQGG